MRCHALDARPSPIINKSGAPFPSSSQYSLTPSFSANAMHAPANLASGGDSPGLVEEIVLKNAFRQARIAQFVLQRQPRPRNVPIQNKNSQKQNTSSELRPWLILFSPALLSAPA